MNNEHSNTQPENDGGPIDDLGGFDDAALVVPSALHEAMREAYDAPQTPPIPRSVDDTVYERAVAHFEQGSGGSSSQIQTAGGPWPFSMKIGAALASAAALGLAVWLGVRPLEVDAPAPDTNVAEADTPPSALSFPPAFPEQKLAELRAVEPSEASLARRAIEEDERYNLRFLLGTFASDGTVNVHDAHVLALALERDMTPDITHYDINDDGVFGLDDSARFMSQSVSLSNLDEAGPSRSSRDLVPSIATVARVCASRPPILGHRDVVRCGACETRGRRS